MWFSYFDSAKINHWQNFIKLNAKKNQLLIIEKMNETKIKYFI